MKARYDPLTVRIFAETPYEHFHEWAHVEQEAIRTIPWSIWNVLRRTCLWPLPCLVMEAEAALMARREMRACRIWEPGDRWEAIGAILTYALPFFT